jgi:hypothetical protein
MHHYSHRITILREKLTSLFIYIMYRGNLPFSLIYFVLLNFDDHPV